MPTYRLFKVGSLYYTKVAVKGPTGVSVLCLLVDTGSTFTILPVEVLETLGCEPTASKEHVRIATGSGFIYAPKVQVGWIQLFGKKKRKIAVIAHTLPTVGPIDGLLGMDLLLSLRAMLNLENGTIEIS